MVVRQLKIFSRKKKNKGSSKNHKNNNNNSSNTSNSINSSRGTERLTIVITNNRR